MVFCSLLKCNLSQQKRSLFLSFSLFFLFFIPQLLNGTAPSSKIFEKFDTMKSLLFLLKSGSSEQVMCGASELLSTVISIDQKSRNDLYESPEKSLLLNWNSHGTLLQKICSFHVTSVLFRFYKEESKRNETLKKNISQISEILQKERNPNPIFFLCIKRTLRDMDMTWKDRPCAKEFISLKGMDVFTNDL